MNEIERFELRWKGEVSFCERSGKSERFADRRVEILGFLDDKVLWVSEVERGDGCWVSSQCSGEQQLVALSLAQ